MGGYLKRVGGWIQGVGVEPILFVHNVCSQVVWIASQDLMTEKACKVNLGYSESICNDLPNHDSEQADTQRLVADIMMYRTILETSIKVVWILILGWFSDRFNRWAPLIISLLGLLGEASIFLLVSQEATWPLQTVLYASLSYSISGGTHALLMLCFAYVSDRSKPRKRTMRMGVLDACYYLGSPVGSAIAGPLLDAGGYIAPFTTAIALYAVTIFYVICRMAHNKHTQDTNEGEIEERKLCDIGQVYESVQVTCISRPYRGRIHILVLMLAMWCDAAPVWGESTVKYLFVQRALGWDHTQYGNWATFASLLSVCVLVLVIPILSVGMGVGDGIIGVLGGLARTLSSILYSCVTSPNLEWIMWFGAVVASGKNMAPVAIRSMLSQIAGPQHTGQVFAVMALGEVCVSLIAAPLYKSVYNATVQTHPSMFYLLSAGFDVILTVLIGGVAISMKQVYRETQEEEETTTN